MTRLLELKNAGLRRKKKRRRKRPSWKLQIVVYVASETKEDLPRNIEIVHSARQARFIEKSASGRALSQELNQMSGASEEAKKLRKEILSAYGSASSCGTLGGETATVRRSTYYSKLSGCKACEVPVQKTLFQKKLFALWEPI